MGTENETAGGGGDVERVRKELRRYEHRLAEFDVAERENGEIELLIRLKDPPPGVHLYRAPLHRRDIAHPQFSWTFQRLLYDCLHDYLVELFVRTPQSRSSTE